MDRFYSSQPYAPTLAAVLRRSEILFQTRAICPRRMLMHEWCDLLEIVNLFV